MNATINTDAYKITHWLQRPGGINKFYSYGEPRSGGQHKKVVFFGMQYILNKYFARSITQEEIEEGYELCRNVFGYDRYFAKEIWTKVKNLGYFPLKIMAVPEGNLVDVSNVFFTIESTEPWFANMVSHFEDYLMWNWYPTAVATRSFYIKKAITPYFEKSCDNPFLDYAVNDFGLRGGVFLEGASIGGAAHLISFNGTDNLPAVKLIKDYYGSKYYGGSVWATEHSVATVWGPKKGEHNYLKAQLDRVDPNATLSVVIDSYDADNFIKNVVGGEEISNIIKSRPGRTVFRPDSNIPLVNVLKYSDMLGDIFEYHLNKKNYKVLNHNVGILQGDGMTEESIPELYKEYIKVGWSADNVVTGSGGGLLVEGLTRDTDRWAVKVSYVEQDDQPIDVQKTPQSDLTKSSKAGKLKLQKYKNNFSTVSSAKVEKALFNSYVDELKLVFENGNLYNQQTFEEIRNIAKSYE